MPVSAATYEQVALEDREGKWELVCGQLRQKPPMTVEHEEAARRLVRRLNLQLSEVEFSVGQESPKLRSPSGNYRIPDVCVAYRAVINRRRRDAPASFEVYDEPVPLVVEVWSPSTGDVDVRDRLLEYQQRGDFEIWQGHPYERTVTTWVRRPDDSYEERLYTGGEISPAYLPGAVITLGELFD